jgi:hypothetical protein
MRHTGSGDPTMASTQLKIVRIAPDGGDAPLSKAQKTFNARIKQIERLRAELAAWEAAVPAFQKRYVNELLPLIEASIALQADWVHRLDAVHGQPGLTGVERRTLRGVIVDLVSELLEEREDAALKAVYNRHAQSDFDAEQASQLAETRAMLEDMLGIELGEEAQALTPDELFRYAHDKKQAQEEARAQRKAARKKTPKQLAREAAERAEEARHHQSLRDIYRKLASALHPDREPDAQERERKTVLMQHVNQAYDRKDLLRLLELQLELEHIGPAATRLGDEALARYNQILKEQVAELQHELHSVEGHFRLQFGVTTLAPLSPGALSRLLADEMRRLRHGMRDMERDMKISQDLPALKAWLRKLRSRPARRGDDPGPW